MYNIDEIIHTPITYDETFGNRTEGTKSTIKCLVEDTSKITSNSQGKTVQADYFIMIWENRNIKKGDNIQITKIGGIEQTLKAREVLKVYKHSTFGGITHMEIYL